MQDPGGKPAIWARYSCYCQEKEALEELLKREERKEINMSPQKRKNREARLRNLTERLIPDIIQGKTI